MRLWPRRKSRWEGVNFLDLVPVRKVTHEEDAEGRIVLNQPRYTDPVLGRWLQPRLSPAKRWLRIPLDGRGSWLWRAADGQRAVGDMVRAFRDTFPEERDDVETRVCRYLAALHQNGWLDLDRR